MHIKLKKRDFLRFYERLHFMPRKRVSKTIKSYKLKNGQIKYKFTIRIDDTHTTTRRGFYTVEEAEIAYINLRKKILDDDYNEHGGYVKFSQIYKDWLKSYKNTVKESTFYKTKSLFKCNVLPHFGDKYIKDIDVNTCQKALNKWVSNLVHYKEVFNYANLIFKEALRRDYISINPMDKLDVPKKTKHKEKAKKNYNHRNFYTIEEQEKFLNHAKNYNFEKYAFFRLLAFTGLRREEMLPLKWNDLKNDMLRVNKALVRIDRQGYKIQSTKNDEIRNLIIDPRTIDILNEWKKQQQNESPSDNQENQLIFMNPKTKSNFSLEVPRRWQQKINDDIQLDHNVTLHGFRHTHGTLLLDNNSDLTFKDLQKRLGHKNLQTTINTYLHATNKSDDKMMEALKKVDDISNSSNKNKKE